MFEDSPMNLKILLPVLFLACPAAAAEARFSPTMLHSLGDCVTPRISAPAGAAQDRANQEYCTENNQGEPEKIKICLSNSKMETVDFFTDRCGENEGVFYISLNGNEYTLHRAGAAPASPVPYAGHFEGEGVSIKVEAGELLTQEMTHAEEGMPSEIISEEYAVTVTVTKDGHTEKIRGVFWQGR